MWRRRNVAHAEVGGILRLMALSHRRMAKREPGRGFTADEEAVRPPYETNYESSFESLYESPAISTTNPQFCRRAARAIGSLS